MLAFYEAEAESQMLMKQSTDTLSSRAVLVMSTTDWMSHTLCPWSCLRQNGNLGQQIGRLLTRLSSYKGFWTVQTWVELTYCWMHLHTWWTSARSTSSLAALLTYPVSVILILGFGALMLAWVTDSGRAASSSHNPKRNKEQLSNRVMESKIWSLLTFLIIISSN